MGGRSPELDEDVDLDLERRQFLLDVHARLDTLTYYELLDVSRSADKVEIKRAYYRLVGIVHPDRYFGKKLGSYKSKMEVIFARLSAAYDTLSKAKPRAEYDATLGAAPTTEAARVKAPVDPKVLEQRKQAMEALRQRFVDTKAKAKQHVDAAARARAAGDLARAVEGYKTALALTPDDAALKATYQEVSRAAAEQLAESHVRQATLEERYGHWREAAASWQRVVDARPNDAAARARLANALERAGGARRG